MSDSATAHRVGLFGSYGSGNFGDDMMAVLFGLHLRRIGIPFSVYRLCPPYASRFDFTVAHTAGELLEGVDTLLWGGGGLLVPWSRLTYAVLFRGVGREYARVVDLARRRGMRLYALSVGGSGEQPARLTPTYKQSFAESTGYISVRNPRDLAIPLRLGVAADYYPDIIWRVSELFPAEHRRSGRLRIGIDVYASNLLRQGAPCLVVLLQTIARRRSDCEFILLDTTNRTVRGYRGLGLILSGPNIRRYQFFDPAEDTALLASLDLVISSRLHTPMIAMQYGVPVLFLFGEGKTTLSLETLGLGRLCYSHRRIGEFVSLMLNAGKLERLLRDFQFPDVAGLAAASQGHLDQLSRLMGRPALSKQTYNSSNGCR